ncbi:putative HTH-type transcriptional regulator YdeE [Paenibacillus sp. J23TS9]|uniref:AraC family transcriptional regulator n=1 Tax=Paenibacillus sp. J23TS9 TaxID=2807193 RepID=UPI001B11CA72|nr:helix-turn-helix domain-containing protein [Paenibacillus sp. J23TS9]GIP26516.1 putative HTH-type transcriptional regulator YdeE [Paenibacillus sp. J23TS9]
MDWLQRMNHAIDYIEDNLGNNIDYEQIARIALCSVYQFQRMFSFVLGVSLSEYIRRRRLTLAAFDLKNRQNKVTDIALKYGYETPESFSRAFQNLHGLTPTSARNAESQLKAYPRISFQMILKGVAEMNYRIEKRDAFQIFGLEDIYTYDNIANPQGVSIPEVWQNISKNGEFDRLRQSVIGDWWREGNFSKELGAVFAFDSYKFTSNTTFPYLIGCYKSEDSGVTGYTVVNVPASTWAVFSTLSDENGSGNYDLRSLKNRVFSEWLQTSNFNILDGGNFEMYCTNKEGYEYCELWFRIEEKQIG